MLSRLIGVMGAMAAVGGTVGFFVFPVGLSMGIKMFVNLAENGMVFPLYMKPPVGPVSTYYLTAVRNPREVLSGMKPAFEVKGPYVFNTELVKEQVEFRNNGDTLSFDSSRRLAWDMEKSANIDEKMWLINPILPGVSKTVRSLVIDRVPFRRLAEPVVFNSVNLLLDTYKERLITKISPRTLMDGRKVKLLEDLTGLASRFGAGSLLPPGPPQNIFGLVYVQNRTIDQMEIWTGVGKTQPKYAEVYKHKGKERLDIWKGKCNAITGTNGELYKPFVKAGKPIPVFLGPLCRSFTLDPLSEDLVKTDSGIKALEYVMTTRLFQGVRSNPGNKCFCTDARTYDCQYDGLVPMGPCFFDSPLFFARTLFKGADPRISELVDMSAARRLNSSGPGWSLPEQQLFKIEPITGTVLEVDLSLMAVFKVVRQPYMRDLSNVQNLTYWPLFVTNDNIKLPFEFVWQIYFLQKLNDYHKPLMAGMAASGLGVLALKLLFGI